MIQVPSRSSVALERCLHLHDVKKCDTISQDMTAVENLRKPAREGTFQRVWVTLSDAHLDRTAPRVDLFVNAHLVASLDITFQLNHYICVI